jgi:hypothetical protein
MYTQKVNYYAAERRPRLSVVDSFAGEGEPLRGRVESE